MKDKLLFFLRLVLFWYGFFVAAKLVFLLVNIHISYKYISAWPGIFIHGFKLDFSTIGYILIIPSLILMISAFLKGRWPFKVIKYYSTLLLFLFSFLIITDLEIYHEWGFRLDATPLLYLKNIHDSFASTPLWLITIMILALVFITFWMTRIFRKTTRIDEMNCDKRQWLVLPVFLVITGSLFIPIRGGFETAPINTGSVYFHTDPFPNHAALNIPWNVMYSITKSKIMVNPYLFDSKLKTNDIIKEYRYSGTTTENKLKISRPNILLIVLESFTANVVGCVNDQIKATPNLDSIAKHGLLFTHFYASGVRSDKGLVAVLSGFPAQPNTSVMIFPDKTQKLPGLPNDLEKAGYSTDFYYGGDINFASMKSYMLNIGFQKIISKYDFPAEQRNMSWGVADEFLFKKVFEDIRVADTPYFKTVFTLASHPPYDFPGKRWKKDNDRGTEFINSIHYTDSCLGLFIHVLEQSGEMKNTLVIMVADHGNLFPGDEPYNSIQKFHIPMIWYGGALNSTGNIDKIASQTDIARTLLEQLKIKTDEYLFSRNIFGNEYQPSAMYAFSEGFGYINGSLNFSYFQNSQQFNKEFGTLNDTTTLPAKKFYQAMYDTFLSLK
jgi:phosphoglycerol transferase MdoB-like AlkP superfamily enzyme